VNPTGVHDWYGHVPAGLALGGRPPW